MPPVETAVLNVHVNLDHGLSVDGLETGVAHSAPAFVDSVNVAATVGEPNPLDDATWTTPTNIRAVVPSDALVKWSPA